MVDITLSSSSFEKRQTSSRLSEYRWLSTSISSVVNFTILPCKTGWMTSFGKFPDPSVFFCDERW